MPYRYGKLRETLGISLALASSAWTGLGEERFHGNAPHLSGVAVWTGSRLFVASREYYTSLPAALVGTYDPADDVWRPVALAGAPTSYGSLVWSGAEVIAWGGAPALNARYRPADDAWRPTSASGAPSARGGHSVVWSGTEVIVWSGVATSSGYTSTGGRYDPMTDTWRATSTTGAPSGRFAHAALWAGDRMVVWGGINTTGELGDGGRYDPVADAWSPMSLVGAPTPRIDMGAVWTGTDVVIWGGGLNGGGAFADGARYSPSTDTWRPVTNVSAPGPRRGNSTVWTGSEMIVWGGALYAGSELQDGGRYDPVADRWTPTAIDAETPVGRFGHVAAWTGTEMIVWGGANVADTGGRYDPVRDAWRPMSSGTAPSELGAPVFTGSELVVWGGNWALKNEGARYDPATARWRATAPSPLAARYNHASVWTGSRVLIWGGNGLYAAYGDGASYDPRADAWGSTSALGAPAARCDHTAVWTGTELVVWGGRDASGSALASGGRYDPSTDTWRPTGSSGAPTGRYRHTCIWTGTKMIVWGGIAASVRDDGGLFDPVADRWTPVSAAGAPAARQLHRASWTGSEMIVWGGLDGWLSFGSGGRYDPVSDTWRPMSASGAPSPRVEHAQVWTGRETVIWGGWLRPGEDTYADGAAYDPVADTWRPLASASPLGPRACMAAVWTGDHVLIWGGTNLVPYRDGGFYDPDADRWRRSPVGNLLVMPGPGGSAAHTARVRGFDEGASVVFDIDAFPNYAGSGAKAAGAWIAAGTAGVIAAPGPGPAAPARVRGFTRGGAPRAGLAFDAYAAPAYGANVGSGRIDDDPALLTGPGPSAAFGPHVRGFRFKGSVTPIAKVSFFAYGTLRYGAAVASAELDRDGFDELLTAPGPGAPFGPHVRGFDYDGVAISAVAGLSFHAYATLRFGVEIGSTDVDLDLRDEILTGPGPSIQFGPHLRAFEYDGATVAPIARINTFAFPGSRLGLTVAGGDIDDDGYGEIVAGAGPDPSFGSRVAAFDDDGRGLRAIPALTFDPYGLAHGARVAAARLVY